MIIVGVVHKLTARKSRPLSMKFIPCDWCDWIRIGGGGAVRRSIVASYVHEWWTGDCCDWAKM